MLHEPLNLAKRCLQFLSYFDYVMLAYERYQALTRYIFSLVPRPSPAPVFDRLQYAKTEPEGLVILPRDPCHWHHVSSRFMEKTAVLATKTRQAPTDNNIKRTKHIRARSHSSEGLPNNMREVSAAVTKCS